MARTTTTEQIVESPEALTPTNLSFSADAVQNPPKLKGRKRLLRSLQRISSSPSLIRLGRPSHYKAGHGSISCISLSSPSSNGHSLSNSYSSNSSGGFSTAPTSLPSTPPPADTSNTPRTRCNIGPVDAQSGPAVLHPKSVPVPIDVRPSSRSVKLVGSALATGNTEDYFPTPTQSSRTKPKWKPRENLDFWGEMPREIRFEILRHLTPKEIVRCAVVSRSWHDMCFNGQLWIRLDASEFYRTIPSDSLCHIITSAGPFLRDLNLRGCLQLQNTSSGDALSDACKNLEYVSLEGSRMEKSSLQNLLGCNSRLVHLNLTGLTSVSNSICTLISKHCQALELVNVSWCLNMDARGVKKMIDGCQQLKDLRVGEVPGFGNKNVMQRIFETNNLERLVLNGCTSLTDEALKIMIEGTNSETDPLTGRPRVPARKLRHLDLGRCHRLTADSIETLAANVPDLEGLQLGGCTDLIDAALAELLRTVPNLTHLDLEELPQLTNVTLQNLARSPCVSRLQHLSISYCEKLGDTGMLPVVKACQKLRQIDMDNTRVSDLVLAEAATMVRERSRHSSYQCVPDVGLRVVAYDCQNVTWTGVREVLSRNAEIKRPPTTTALLTGPSFPTEIIQIKCFYGWQMTVDEHTKRVLKGELAAAVRLEQKWAGYMMATEEVGAGGAHSRRRRRRAREAAMLHADEEEGGISATGGPGRRRRARSGGCTIM
ncbi:MAG: hypothetical protein M1837_004080 [Sclerophora amabilis]|nr:MAG: hypothetical protein M1837_004080 [Sclerophora amabilis]